MRRLALLALAGALMAATPAHADFFKDLGSALGDLGESIGDAARDVGNAVDEAFTAKPAEEAKPEQPQAAPQINWNPPAVTPYSGAMLYTPPITRGPPPLPERRRAQLAPASAVATAAAVPQPAAPVVGARRGAVDDAPPPRRAPRRDPVLTSYIAPLPGFSEAPPRPAASYTPVMAAATMPPVAATPSRVPAPKPMVVQGRDFTVSFSNRSARVSDMLLYSSGASPGDDSRAVIDAVAAALKRDGSQRVRLASEAVALNDRLSEARRRSFERARLVKGWLEKAGARPTQIDLDVRGAGNADQVTLNVYKP